MPDVIQRGLLTRASATPSGDRRATFTAASQHGVVTWDGRQYLDMRGADLARYNANPVVIDSHNTFDADRVIGSAEVRVDGSELVADVTFAPSERAGNVWALVDSGHLRAVSIGFMPTRRRRIEAGETAELAEGQIVEGPAEIVDRWELYEISMVPIPADPTALKRSIEEREPGGLAAMAGLADVVSAVFAASTVREAAREGELQEDGDMADPTKTEAAAVQSEDAEVLAERKATELGELRKRQIMALAPSGCEREAEACVVEGVSVEVARERIKAEFARQREAVGTPEAPEVERSAPAEGAKEERDVTLEETRAACGLG